MKIVLTFKCQYLILQNEVDPFRRASFKLVQQLCCIWHVFGHLLQDATPAARFVKAYSVTKKKKNLEENETVLPGNTLGESSSHNRQGSF